MDYIFKEWEEKLKAMADSVEKDLKEIRKCKADVQQMKLDVVAEVQKGRYVRDNEQLIISAPRIILGNVDRNGTLKPGASEIIIRGTQVGVEAAGEAGQVAMGWSMWLAHCRRSSLRHVMLPSIVMMPQAPSLR